MVRERESDKKCGEYKIESKSWDLIKTILAKKNGKNGKYNNFLCLPHSYACPKVGKYKNFLG